ncbi:Txe/YoeB family addiction module toxin [Persicitalea sp.]|uniref:Txe/YoeB family addiction module toxin n=1 Tax=Persicitalea sp. TaxID=3100273 RepID=UPI0035946F63
MEIEYTFQANEDLAYWKKTNNRKVLKRIRALIESLLENTFEGIGKPEPLKHDLSGCWSRRIDREHRIVYSIDGNTVEILSLRGHY